MQSLLNFKFTTIHLIGNFTAKIDSINQQLKFLHHKPQVILRMQGAEGTFLWPILNLYDEGTNAANTGFTFLNLSF